ncbi:MAG TPA: T9SS type A sorting domain-containing protein [Saprospiraceae bacterium]|nr:T9SS type A sorting domain-containing protein [Saprospiraceae bacterium]
MKNRILSKLVVIFFFLYTTNGYSQIPNASFEIWDTTENIFFPVGWEKISNEPRISRDTLSFNGKYSLHIFPDSIQFYTACSHGLRITLDSTENLDSTKVLSLHAILKPFASPTGAFLSIELSYYKNNTFIKTDKIWHYQGSQEWKEFLLPFNSVEKDVIILTISGGGVVYDTDGCGLISNIWIDNIKVIDKSTVNSINLTQQNKPIHLSPNPVMDILTIDSPMDWQFISIYDISGRLINSGLPFQNNLDVSHLEAGTYILHIRDKVSTANKIFVKL